MAFNADSLKFTPSNFEVSQARNTFLKSLLWRCLGVNIRMTLEESEFFLGKVYSTCLATNKDYYQLHRKRRKGLQYLEEIITRSNPSHFNKIEKIHLIWSSITCVYHFLTRIRRGSCGFLKFSSQRQLETSTRLCKEMLRFFQGRIHKNTLLSVMVFFEEGSLWAVPELCSLILCEILSLLPDIREGILEILKSSERCVDTKPRDAIETLTSLSNILSKLNLTLVTTDFLETFLNILEAGTSTSSSYYLMSSAIQLCLQQLLQNLSNEQLLATLELLLQWLINKQSNTDLTLQLGRLAEFAAMMHQATSFCEAVPQKIFNLIHEAMSAQDALLSLIGNRILQNLMDKNGYKNLFKRPRIYFRDSKYGFEVLPCSLEDRKHFRKNRSKMHNQLFYSISKHVNNRVLLESTYTTLAVILVEVPCGYSAASGVCFAMAIQQYTLSNEMELTIEHSHQLHAFVMAILSLVCYVHNAETFYEYICEVMHKRADFAPHLNPPFKACYDYAEHHVLWNKPELFFDDWQARYGLWKRFRKSQLKNDNKI